MKLPLALAVLASLGSLGALGCHTDAAVFVSPSRASPTATGPGGRLGPGGLRDVGAVRLLTLGPARGKVHVEVEAMAQTPVSALPNEPTTRPQAETRPHADERKHSNGGAGEGLGLDAAGIAQLRAA